MRCVQPRRLAAAVLLGVVASWLAASTAAAQEPTTTTTAPGREPTAEDLASANVVGRYQFTGSGGYSSDESAGVLIVVDGVVAIGEACEGGVCSLQFDLTGTQAISDQGPIALLFSAVDFTPTGGGAYQISNSTESGVFSECVNVVDGSLQVTDAVLRNGEWEATAFSATYNDSITASAGCIGDLLATTFDGIRLDVPAEVPEAGAGDRLVVTEAGEVSYTFDLVVDPAEAEQGSEVQVDLDLLVSGPWNVPDGAFGPFAGDEVQYLDDDFNGVPTACGVAERSETVPLTLTVVLVPADQAPDAATVFALGTDGGAAAPPATTTGGPVVTTVDVEAERTITNAGCSTSDRFAVSFPLALAADLPPGNYVVLVSGLAVPRILSDGSTGGLTVESGELPVLAVVVPPPPTTTTSEPQATTTAVPPPTEVDAEQEEAAPAVESDVDPPADDESTIDRVVSVAGDVGGKGGILLGSLLVASVLLPSWSPGRRGAATLLAGVTFAGGVVELGGGFFADTDGARHVASGALQAVTGAGLGLAALASGPSGTATLARLASTVPLLAGIGRVCGLSGGAVADLLGLCADPDDPAVEEVPAAWVRVAVSPSDKARLARVAELAGRGRRIWLAFTSPGPEVGGEAWARLVGEAVALVGGVHHAAGRSPAEHLVVGFDLAPGSTGDPARLAALRRAVDAVDAAVPVAGAVVPGLTGGVPLEATWVDVDASMIDEATRVVAEAQRVAPRRAVAVRLRTEPTVEPPLAQAADTGADLVLWWPLSPDPSDTRPMRLVDTTGRPLASLESYRRVQARGRRRATLGVALLAAAIFAVYVVANRLLDGAELGRAVLGGAIAAVAAIAMHLVVQVGGWPRRRVLVSVGVVALGALAYLGSVVADGTGSTMARELAIAVVLGVVGLAGTLWLSRAPGRRPVAAPSGGPPVPHPDPADTAPGAAGPPHAVPSAVGPPPGPPAAAQPAPVPPAPGPPAAVPPAPVGPPGVRFDPGATAILPAQRIRPPDPATGSPPSPTPPAPPRPPVPPAPPAPSGPPAGPR
jgi:hypothetical protein